MVTEKLSKHLLMWMRLKDLDLHLRKLKVPNALRL